MSFSPSLGGACRFFRQLGWVEARNICSPWGGVQVRVDRERGEGGGGQTAGLGAGQENLLTLGRGGMRLGTEEGREGGAGQLGLVEDRSSC